MGGLLIPHMAVLLIRRCIGHTWISFYDRRLLDLQTVSDVD
ncbi:MAG: hypothetical protein ACI9J5_002871 [Paraglaciecola sp.]|jgi:hypothetical protein